MRAALKRAQAERQKLALVLVAVEIPQGGKRPLVLSGAQIEQVAGIQKGIADAQRSLLAFQQSARGFKGRWVDHIPEPLTVKDLEADPWSVFVRYEQLAAENMRLRRLLAVLRRLGCEL